MTEDRQYVYAVLWDDGAAPNVDLYGSRETLEEAASVEQILDASLIDRAEESPGEAITSEAGFTLRYVRVIA